MPILNTSLTLKDLPPPPPGKTGWPWTEQSQPLPKQMPDGCEWPLISVVTPSYNQGQFIEETIRSVLLQGYPNLEYIIIDGGSTDNTIEIIKKYEQYLAYWVSEPDRGQSHALNKGFHKATGQLIGWQNADDFYYPNAFTYLSETYQKFSIYDVFYGAKDYVDINSNFLHSLNPREPNFENMLPWICMFSEATFYRDKVFKQGYFLNENLQYYIDFDFYWKLLLAGFTFKNVPKLKAGYRQHDASKSNRIASIAQQEAFDIYKRVYLSRQVPNTTQIKLINSMQCECLNDFGSYRFPLYRKHVHELIQTTGISSLTVELCLKYLVTLAGTAPIYTIKQIRDYLLRRQ